MAISVGTAQHNTFTGGIGATNTFAFTCSAPGQRILFFIFYGYGSADMTLNVSTYIPTYAGTDMTLLNRVGTSRYSQWISTEVWYILDANMPGSSGSNNIVTKVAGSSYNNGYIAFEITSANQSAPQSAAYSATNGPTSPIGPNSVTPDGASGVVFDSAFSWNGALTKGSAQTLLDSVTVASQVIGYSSYKTFSSQTSQSMTWTYSTVDEWDHIPFTVNDYIAPSADNAAIMGDWC